MMSKLSQVLKSFFGIFKYHKLKIFAFFILSFVFTLILFPFDDLTDFMTSKIAAATNNQVYVQSDSMSLSINSGLGVRLYSVLLQAMSFPPLHLESIVIAPSITSLLKGAPGAQVHIEDLFKSDLHLSLESGEKTKAGATIQVVNLEAEGLALQALSKYLKEAGLMDFSLQGSLQLLSNFNIDPSFVEPPQAHFDINLANFVFNSYSLNLNGFAVELPTLKLKKSKAKLKLAENRLQVEELTLGDAQDELQLKLKGDIGLQLAPGGIGVQAGAYNFLVDLTVQPIFQKQNGAMFILIDNFKKVQANGSLKYTFKASAPYIQAPAQMSPLAQF